MLKKKQPDITVTLSRANGFKSGANIIKYKRIYRSPLGLRVQYLISNHSCRRTRRTSEYVVLQEKKYVALLVKKIIVFGPRMICPLNIQHPSKRAFKFFSKFSPAHAAGFRRQIRRCAPHAI